MPDPQQPDQNHLFNENKNINTGQNNSGYIPMSASTDSNEANTAYGTNIPQPQVNPQPYTPNQPVQYTNYYPQPPIDYGNQYQNPNPYGQQASIANPYFQIQGQPQPVPAKKSENINNLKLRLNKIGAFMVAKWWLILLLIAGISAMFIGLYSYLNPAKTPTGAFNNVDVSIQAPQTSPSGSPATWKIIIKNRESVSIQNVVVSLNLDRSFKYSGSIPSPSKPDGSEFQIARLDGFNQGSYDQIIQLEGSLVGNIDEETLISGSVSYTPSPLLSVNNNRRSVSIAGAKTKITQPQIQLTLLATNENIQNGGEAELSLIFKNTSEQELTQLKLEMIYPDRNGFNYSSSEFQQSSTSETKTKPDDSNNIWYIPRLPRLQEQSLKVRGNVYGADGVKVTFGVKVGIRTNGSDYVTVATTAKDVTISAQPLLINTSIDNKISSKVFAPGETLNFTINYQNNGTATLKNVSILGFVDDPANILDYTTVAFIGGDRGSVNNRTIQWTATGVPQLANLSPKAKGQLKYSIRVAESDVFIKSNLAQNAYTITPKVTSKSDNLSQVDVAGDLYKARGSLQFFQTIKNKGTDPTNKNRVTYTVTWTLKDRQTQINDVSISTISPLPITAWQQSSIDPASSSSVLAYNKVNGTITWKPGKLAQFVGTGSNPGLSVSFDLVVESTNSGSTKNIDLFAAPKVSGVDDFTGETYDLQGQAGKTN